MMDSQNENENKHPKRKHRHRDEPYPTDKRMKKNKDNPLSLSSGTNPITIVIPPARTETGSPATPTKTTRESIPNDATPTGPRTSRSPAGQVELAQVTPLTLACGTRPTNQGQGGDEDDNMTDSSRYNDSPTDQEDHHPFGLQAGESNMTPSEPTAQDLLALLLRVEDMVITLQQEGHLDQITKEEGVARTLKRLSESLPIVHANMQLEPLISGIGNLCQKVNTLTESLEKQNTGNTVRNTLQNSMHAPVPGTHNDNASHTMHTLTPYADAVQNSKRATNPKPDTQSNPRLAHHYTRLVAQFLPNGVPLSNRREPSDIVSKINASLTSTPQTKHIRVVAANYNKQGNIIISTRADQTAAELAKHEEIIKPALVRISGIREVVIREDKKWYKVQIDGVSTGSLTLGGGRTIYTGEKIHDELLCATPCTPS